MDCKLFVLLLGKPLKSTFYIYQSVKSIPTSKNDFLLFEETTNREELHAVEECMQDNGFLEYQSQYH